MNLKEILAKKKIVVGLERVKKMLCLGKISGVYVSKNCPEILEVKGLCELAEVELEVLKVDSNELGLICRKPFSVSAVAILK